MSSLIASIYGLHGRVFLAAAATTSTTAPASGSGGSGRITCTSTGVPHVVPTGTLPGSTLLTSVLGGILWFGVALSIVGLVVAAICMALGSHSQNSRLAEGGRRGLISSAISALVCGGAVAIVGFAFSAGQTIHC